MSVAIGVNSPKKIKPSTRGLIIIPSKNPNRIHSLFSGRSASLLISVIRRNIDDAPANVYAQPGFEA